MKKISIAILTLLVVMSACKKVPEVNLKYVDVERDLITVGTTTATVQCDYQYIATLKKAYLSYGEGQDEADMNTAEMRVVQNTLYVDLAGLKSNTTYSYYYEFHNGFNSMRTALKTFKTEVGNGGGDEPPTPPEIMLPTVITAEVTEVTTNSAQCGGEVVNDGGAEVTERGICWGTNENPTLNDSHIAVGSGIGVFTAAMNGLEANTTYHVRAYAINEAGTAYGLDKEFSTLSGGGSGNAPIGAIDGLFTINDNGDKVYFSKGNLQYQASTNTWRFAENQWDHVGTQNPYIGSAGGTVNGSDNTFISPTYDGWIDLFGWGTSGWDNGNLYYQPYNIEKDYDNIYIGFGYGPTDGTNYNYGLTDEYANADWGVYNAIINGGNVAGKWRTWSEWEWMYILFSRSTVSGIRYAKAQVNGVNGIILLPDNWITSYYSLNDTDSQAASFSSNTLSVPQWNILENKGAVFLPTAGIRDVVAVYSIGSAGVYWTTTTCDDYDYVYSMTFGEGGFNMYGANSKYFGQSVRLVQDAR